MPESKKGVADPAEPIESREEPTSDTEYLDLNLLPLNGIIGWPGDSVLFTLSAPNLIKGVERSIEEGLPLFAYPLRNGSNEEGRRQFGCLAHPGEAQRKASKQYKFRLDFFERAELTDVSEDSVPVCGKIRVVRRDIRLNRAELDAFHSELSERLIALNAYVDMNPVLEDLSLSNLDNIIGRINSAVKLNFDENMDLLEGWSFRRRFEKLLGILDNQVEVQRIRSTLNHRTKSRMKRIERNAFLMEEKRLIERELGVDKKSERFPEGEEIERSIKKFRGPAEAKNALEREFAKLTRTGLNNSQSDVSLNYIQTILELPWEKHGTPREDWNQVEELLDKSHYGLEKVKKRILEQLALYHLTGKPPGTILCLVGPPGVGKTSIARSAAEALGLPFVKKSLGGVHDEAEIRGHRRTYIGSMPGRVLQGIRKAEVNNPVFLLDEVDKMGKDHRGSPADALLEVLDPDENSNFSDHYLELEFDLSRVFFILTANQEQDIPPVLRDRLEILRFSGYAECEKLVIAKEHLCRRTMSRLGLEDTQLKIADGTLKEIIRRYTREPGVRDLNRRISVLVQDQARRCVSSKTKRTKSWNLARARLKEVLGAPPHQKPPWKKSSFQTGVMAGLAYNPSGGSVLRMECTLTPGEHKVLLTGKLGEVLRESAQAALSLVRSAAEKLKLDAGSFKNNSFHIHLPSGAVPKEGPSAGLGLALLIYSSISGRKSRPMTAVTGEISLHGRVLRIGGVKEKLLAALQEGFECVVLPEANRSDVEEIPAEHLKGLQIKYVGDFYQALSFFFPES